LFFVRDFTTDPTRLEANCFSDTPNGDRVDVTFSDTGVLVGSTQSYAAEGQGFFRQPVDPSRTVNAAGVQHMRVL